MCSTMGIVSQSGCLCDSFGPVLPAIYGRLAKLGPSLGGFMTGNFTVGGGGPFYPSIRTVKKQQAGAIFWPGTPGSPFGGSLPDVANGTSIWFHCNFAEKMDISTVGC